MTNSTAEGSPIKFRQVNAKKFIERRDKLSKSKAAFLTLYNKGKYIKLDTKLFLSSDNLSGYGVNPDGELVSVFSIIEKRGPAIVKSAIANGAVKLSCLGEKLREMYTLSGFSVTTQDTWSDEYAPPDWDYEKFGKQNVYNMEIVEINKPLQRILQMLQKKDKSA